jgi:hypothetical protein
MPGRGLFHRPPQPQQRVRDFQTDWYVLYVQDDFTRSVSDGWGAPTIGNAGNNYGNTDADHDVTGTVGTVSQAASVTNTATLDSVSAQNFTYTIRMAIDKTPTGSDISRRLIFRTNSFGSGNYYMLLVNWFSDGGNTLQLQKVVGGSPSIITTTSGLEAREPISTQWFTVKIQTNGTTIRARIWREDHSEPGGWDIDTTDSESVIQGPGGVGIAVASGAISNAPILASFDDLNVFAGIAPTGAVQVNVTASDTVTFSDSVTRTGTFLRTLSDTVTADNTVSRTGTFLRTLSDSLTLSDSVTRLITVARTATDTVSLANTVVRVGTFLRTTSDSVTFSDSVARIGTFLRTLSDSVSFADVVAGVKILPRTVADTVSFSDAVTRTGTFLRTLSDSVTAGNTVARVGTFLRTAADAVSFAESVVAEKTGGIVSRTVADAIAFSDAVNRTATNLRTAADTVSFADTVTRSVGRFRTAADSVSLGNTVARVLSAARTASDSVTLSQTVTRVGAFLRTLANLLGLTDTVSKTVIGQTVRGYADCSDAPVGGATPSDALVAGASTSDQLVGTAVGSDS